MVFVSKILWFVFRKYYGLCFENIMVCVSLLNLKGSHIKKKFLRAGVTASNSHEVVEFNQSYTYFETIDQSNQNREKVCDKLNI